MNAEQLARSLLDNPRETSEQLQAFIEDAMALATLVEESPVPSEPLWDDNYGEPW
jgi:hypothetical protein